MGYIIIKEKERNTKNTGRKCREILIQLVAVTNATKKLDNYILENHLYSCITNEFENGNLDSLDEVSNLF